MNKYPLIKRRLELANEFDRTESEIDDWFRNRRLEDRKSTVLKQNAREDVEKSQSYTKSQKSKLEMEFSIDQHPNKETIIEIANALGRTQKQIFDWFSYRRMKESETLEKLKNFDDLKSDDTTNSLEFNSDDNAGLLRQPQVLKEGVKNDEFECKKSTAKGHCLSTKFGKQNCELPQHFKSKGTVTRSHIVTEILGDINIIIHGVLPDTVRTDLTYY